MCFKGHKLLSSCWENKKVVLCCCAQQIDLDCYQEYWTGIWVRFTRKVAQPLYFLSVRRRNAKSGVPQNTGCEVVGTVRCWRSYCSLDREQGFIRRRLQPQNQLRRTVLRLLKQVCIQCGKGVVACFSSRFLKNWRFGPGLVIYWFGYLVDLQPQHPQILLMDHFPVKLETIQVKNRETWAKALHIGHCSTYTHPPHGEFWCKVLIIRPNKDSPFC